MAFQLLSMCLLCSLLQRVIHPPAEVRAIREALPEICKVVLVHFLEPSFCRDTKLSSPPDTEPCRWQINVVSLKRPDVHLIGREEPEKYTPREVSLLRELDGCNSSESCKNESLPCAYGIEDPSDAFWLRKYDRESKFVVMFQIAFASLLFFLVSIISEGSIYYPHAPGSFSLLSAATLSIIALSALLYLIIVPREYQLSLYGQGLWQSFGYCCIILTVAAALPFLTVVWISFCLFAIYFLGFFVEQLLCMIGGTLYYLGALFAYQAEHTLYELRLMYGGGNQDQAEIDRQVLQMSETFLRRVRGNVFLYRIPEALEQDGIQVVGNTLPEHLFDEMVQENVPQIDFEGLDDSPDENAPSSTPTVTTPLLQQNQGSVP